SNTKQDDDFSCGRLAGCQCHRQQYHHQAAKIRANIAGSGVYQVKGQFLPGNQEAGYTLKLVAVSIDQVFAKREKHRRSQAEGRGARYCKYGENRQKASCQRSRLANIKSVSIFARSRLSQPTSTRPEENQRQEQAGNGNTKECPLWMVTKYEKRTRR